MGGAGANAGPGAQTDSQTGAQIAAICASCHRLDGGGANPPIIGWETERLVGRMWAYKSDAMSNHNIMHAVSLSLSDDELATAARYLAALRPDATKR